MRTYPTDVSDAPWAIIGPLLQRHGRMGRPTELDLRHVLNAILYWERTGCQWRCLPKDFPNWTSVRSYFDPWTRDGTWQRVNAALREPIREQIGRQAQPSAAILDSQRVNTTEAGGERGYEGGTKGERAHTHLAR